MKTFTTFRGLALAPPFPVVRNHRILVVAYESIARMYKGFIGTAQV